MQYISFSYFMLQSTELVKEKKIQNTVDRSEC